MKREIAHLSLEAIHIDTATVPLLASHNNFVVLADVGCHRHDDVGINRIFLRARPCL
jgi:hypothetical protein